MSNLTAAAPERTLEQRMRALERANDTRIRRSQLRRELGCGDRSFSDLLNDPPDWLLTARVYDVLIMVRGIGPSWAGRVFSRNAISLTKTFGGITHRQREAIVLALNSAPSFAPRRRQVCSECGADLRGSTDGAVCGFCREEIEQR